MYMDSIDQSIYESRIEDWRKIDGILCMILCGRGRASMVQGRKLLPEEGNLIV